MWLRKQSADRFKSAAAHHRFFDVDVLSCHCSLDHHLVMKEWRDDDIDRVHALLASDSGRSVRKWAAHCTTRASACGECEGAQVCGPHRLRPGRSHGIASKRRLPRPPPPRGPGRCRSNRPRSPVRSVPVRCGGMAPPRATLHPRAQCATTCSPSSQLYGKSPSPVCVLPGSALL